MLSQQAHLKDTATLLSDNYLINFPAKAAREFAAMPTSEAAAVLVDRPLAIVVPLFRNFSKGVGESLLLHWPRDRAVDLLLALDIHQAASVLSSLEIEQQQELIDEIKRRHTSIATEFLELISYSERTAGRMMEKQVQAFYESLRVEEVLEQLKLRKPKLADALFLINNNNQLVGYLELSDLVLADPKSKARALTKPITVYSYALDAEDDVIEKFEGSGIAVMPVLDANDQLVGAIRALSVYQRTKEDLVSDMASMVGASKDEKSLSTSWFAVKKRMPWLQINLLTAFLAAAVVGAFEDIIAQFTALAILLPVAAGQSGNAGAQALAVTMRGLTLKEITTRHWWQVFRKETAVGFLNGVAIAITCSIAVWWWSNSVGLALVMILAMITSLTIACSAGALVPIALKKFGLDPAQSSSIVLTTITDIAGFLSFLGIAALLANMLPKG